MVTSTRRRCPGNCQAMVDHPDSSELARKEVKSLMTVLDDLPDPTEGLNGFRLLPNSTVSDDETSIEHSCRDERRERETNLLSSVEDF